MRRNCQLTWGSVMCRHPFLHQRGAVKPRWVLSLAALFAVVAGTVWYVPALQNKLVSLWTGQEAVAPTEARAKNFKGGKGGGEGSRNTPVRVGEVRQMDIRYTVQAAGTLLALNTAVVRAKVDGELKALRFTEGQYVQAGQLLAEIDARPFEAQLSQAQGQYARDAALLKNAELDLQRYQDLLSKDAIARQQVETQAALVRQLQGTVQADQAQIDLAKLQLSYTRVTATISGRLGLKQVELGSLVRSSDPNGLVSITQTQPMAVVFSVPEVHVPIIMRKLKAGQALPVEAWDRDQKVRLAQGRVSTTDNAIDVATSTLRLKATLDNRDASLFPNQFANIRLQLDTVKQALVVPAQAVQRGAAGTFVYVVQADNTVQVKTVQLDAVEGDWQAVKGDLQVGQQVVTDGADRLRSGSGVEVVKAPKP
ncbi:MAG: efflux RND transporter periplasmic adaptor subunit [Betaproteobacteria bacterium]|nr:efflux RND transporter periplasmic adaptor subunit [Betaproteobacteria bacterium]